MCCKDKRASLGTFLCSGPRHSLDWGLQQRLWPEEFNAKAFSTLLWTVTEAVPVLKGITHNFWLVTPGTAGFTSSTQGGATWKGREGPSGAEDLSSRLTLRNWEAREQFCLVAKQYHKLDDTETISVPVLTQILEEDNVNLA